MAAAHIATQITYNQPLKNNIIARLLNEQMSHTVERTLVKSIINSAGKSIDVAKHFKEHMKITQFGHDAKVQSIQDLNWQFCNAYIIAASDSSPLYVINTRNGFRQSVTFLQKNNSLHNNSLATNGRLVAHAEGTESQFGINYHVVVWSTDSFKMVNSFDLPLNAVPQALAISDTGEFLAVGFADSTGRYIRLSEIKSRKEIITLAGAGGSFKGDYFEYYTTPNAADLILNVVALKKLKNDNHINQFDHGEYDCDVSCNSPRCLQRKAPHLFAHHILSQHPTEGTVFSYDEKGIMIFPQLVVDQNNNSAGLITQNSVTIYTLEKPPRLVKIFKKFNQKTDEIELIVPQGDIVVIRDKNNALRRVYSIEREELLNEFSAHVNSSVRFNAAHNVLGWYQNSKWSIAPTHKYVLDHANPQEMLEFVQEIK